VADESAHEDQQFERYLLGMLSDDEAERLDELSIADDEAAWRLSAVENDLVDAYVRGELHGETLQRFDAYYLASPRRRAKVMFARTLLLGDPSTSAAAATVAAPAAAATPRAVVMTTPASASSTPSASSVSSIASAGASRPRAVESAAGAATGPVAVIRETPRTRERWIDRLFPRGNAPWGLLAGVAALLLIVCGLLIVQDLRMRQAVTREEQDRAALEQRAQDLQRQLDAQRAANASATAELERLRAGGTSGAAGGTGAGTAPQQQTQVAGGTRPDDRTGSVSPSVPTTIALVLWPRTRSAGAAATLALPPGTDRVAVDLRIEANDFAHYEAVLKDLTTSQVVWRSGRLAAKAAADHTSVIVAIPGSTLTPRRYALDLMGHHATGEGELISSYPFQVLGR
jgi:hypothetical protein